MNLDPRIKDAIVEAAKELEQDPGLASKLIAWFEALAEGNETLDDRDSVSRHLELLYQAAVTEGQYD